MSGLTDQRRDELAGVLMRAWGCDAADEDAYDGACRDLDLIAPLLLAEGEQALRERVEAVLQQPGRPCEWGCDDELRAALDGTTP